MDQSQDKFAQLSPVLELVYVMLTNMAKYMDVYAKDINAQETEQYTEARDAVNGAIRKFDTLYGLKSPASDESTTQPVAQEPVAQNSSSTQPYDFAAGSDPESLKKAKEAVEELKTLFGDMKKQEAATIQPPSQDVAPSVQQQPEPTYTQPMPTFMAAESMSQDMSAGTPVNSTPTVQEAAPVQTPQTTELPTPTNTPAATQDAGEIDSILAELKKLQNKGSVQM